MTDNPNLHPIWMRHFGIKQKVTDVYKRALRKALLSAPLFLSGTPGHVKADRARQAIFRRTLTYIW